MPCGVRRSEQKRRASWVGRRMNARSQRPASAGLSFLVLSNRQSIIQSFYKLNTAIAGALSRIAMSQLTTLVRRDPAWRSVVW